MSVIISNEFKEQRKEFLNNINNDKKKVLEKIPENKNITGVYLNIFIQKYIEQTDRSPVVILGDKFKV